MPPDNRVELSYDQFVYCKTEVENHGIAFASAYAEGDSRLAITYYRSTGQGPYVQWQPASSNKSWLQNFEVFKIVADGCVARVVKEWT